MRTNGELKFLLGLTPVVQSGNFGSIYSTLHFICILPLDQEHLLFFLKDTKSIYIGSRFGVSLFLIK